MNPDPLVAAGTHDAFSAIQIDPQLANQFEPALLPAESMNEDDLRLLASFEPALRLERPSNLIDPVFARRSLSFARSRLVEVAKFQRGFRARQQAGAVFGGCKARAATAVSRGVVFEPD